MATKMKAVLGWLFFSIGILHPVLLIKLVLLTGARVLPPEHYTILISKLRLAGPPKLGACQASRLPL